VFSIIMSLIVTSNVDDEIEITNTSNIFKPYSYSNRLLNTLKIPANSEIALQSAKINKTGEFVISKSNSIFGHYFGTPLTKDGANADSTTSVPFIGYAGNEVELEDGAKINTNVAGFSNMIQSGFAERAYHPSLITASSANLTVNPSYAANVWDGYDWVFTQQTAKTTKNATFNFTNTASAGGGFNAAGNTVTAVDQHGFQVRADNMPISQNQGEVIMDFSAGNTSANNVPWCCGLTRINTAKARGRFVPDAYNVRRTTGKNPSTGAAETQAGVFMNKGGDIYTDICVMRIGDNLRVFQSGVNSAGAGGGNAELVQNEVIYYGDHNANFDNVVNINASGGTGATDFGKVKFTLNNEELSIHIITNGGAETLLVDFTTITAAGGLKNEVTNPTTCAKWAMYPIFSAKGAGNAITLDSVSHYTNYPDLAVDPDPTRYDWWQWCEDNENQTRWPRSLESRDFNDKNSATILVPKKVNGGGGMDGYENQIITAQINGPSLSANAQIFGLLSSLTGRCNTAELFGFRAKPISPTGTTTNTVVNVSSISTPTLSSNVSLFIRLNNFTQLSTNARMGTQSKIVAHLPRFDTSGNDTGGLYFEPSERTYIDLNNPNDLYLNSFDVDYCYENERLCTSLVGKTITCFHIRKKST
jgi:hypothetical protein